MVSVTLTRRSHVRRFVLLAAVAALALLVGLGLGCATSSGPSGPGDDDGPGCVIFVDAAYSGDETGTKEQPFNTIDEGVAAADSGCVVRLAAGTYASARGSVVVPHLMGFIGAGKGESRVDATFELAMFTPTDPVRVCSLSCENVVFGIKPDSTAYAFAPVTISDCHLDAIAETTRAVGSNAPFRLIDCEVDGSIDIMNRSCESARTVRGCNVGGDVLLHQIAGDTSAVLNSTVGGDVSLWTVVGERQTVSGNTVAGSVKLYGVSIDEQAIESNTVSGDSLYTWSMSCDRTTVTGNAVPNAAISCTGTSSSDLSVDDNVLAGAGIVVIAKATYGSISGNSVTLPRYGDDGIRLRARVSDLDITDNTVAMPYGPPTGVPAEEDTLAPAAIRAISVSGPFVRDNSTTGGTYGVYCLSVSAEVTGNAVSGAHTGIYVRATACDIDDNAVTDCVGDGLHLGAKADTMEIAAYFVSANTLSDNGGAGIRANATAVLGVVSGRTGNTLTGNGDYDLVVETQASEAETLLAEGNLWDHATVEDVDLFDVWDGKDDPSLAVVLLEPLGSGGGAW